MICLNPQDCCQKYICTIKKDGACLRHATQEVHYQANVDKKEDNRYKKK